jgi:plasmid stability protein
MATLHVRQVPDELYDELRAMAAQERRSLSAQVVSLLDRAVAHAAQRGGWEDVLGRLEARQAGMCLPPGAPLAQDLVREDRER